MRVAPGARPGDDRTPRKARTFNPANPTDKKDYSIDDLPSKAARERLVELNYDDEDQISRLRVTGRRRLYGFRRDERFSALWWDPEHSIYPSPKKHT